MNVVDSSAWLEYFADAPAAQRFAAAIEDRAALIVPTLVVYEVFKAIARQRSEDEALRAYAIMAQGRVVPLDAELALASARLTLELGLPLADSLILATAQATEATLWTQDAHFRDLPGVRYVEKMRDP